MRSVLRTAFAFALALVIFVPRAEAQKPKPISSTVDLSDSSKLVISAASFDATAQQLSIFGANFGPSPGFVGLNGFPLPVSAWDNTSIVVALSSSTPPGSYLLTVSRGPSSTQFDTFSVAIGGLTLKGEKGDPGEKGEKGDKGDKGDAGEKGATGDPGPKGDTGLQGPKGDQGDPGVKGDQGLQGVKGDTGATGAQGPQGPQGETGPMGPIGPMGPSGLLGLAGKSCPTDQVVQGFDGQGELVCTNPRTLGRYLLGRCGASNYDVDNFVPAGSGLTVVATCTPSDTMQALLVTRFGHASLNAAEVEAYVNNGGIVITERGASFAVYNKVFGTAFAQPASTVGGCFDNVAPRAQMTPADPFWAANAPFVAEATYNGCGYDLALLPNITPLGRHLLFPTTLVNLAYASKGQGRVWLVESDWSDGDMVDVNGDTVPDQPAFSANSRKLMRYMVGHK